MRELSLRHNIFIGGCGCCGSPFLITGKEDPDTKGAYVVDDKLGYKTIRELEESIEYWSKDCDSCAEEYIITLEQVKSILSEVEQ